jgi:cell division protein FtsB
LASAKKQMNDFLWCFTKWQKTCAAYQELRRENRKLEQEIQSLKNTLAVPREVPDERNRNENSSTGVQ